MFSFLDCTPGPGRKALMRPLIVVKKEILRQTRACIGNILVRIGDGSHYQNSSLFEPAPHYNIRTLHFTIPFLVN